MLRVDLGCGRTKADGFIGLDRFQMPGVDLIGDLDAALPFQSNSVDLIYASHSLEHVRDLSFTIREIYRVLRHGGQLCVVAPYSEQKLNIANPYHLVTFNEHTPRFWTNYQTADIEPEEYEHPQTKQWGLLESDNSQPDIDLRLVNMEFFYFPEFRKYSEGEKRLFRQHRIDVCDQISYHLIAWKPAEADDPRPFEEHLAAFTPYESALIRHRRKSDKHDLASRKPSAKTPDEQLPDLLDRLADPNGGRADVSRSERPTVGLLQTLINDLVEARRAEAKTTISSLRAEIEVSDVLIDEYRNRIEELRGYIGHLESQAEAFKHSFAPSLMFGKATELAALYAELSGYRHSRAQRIASRFRSDTLWLMISPAFSELKTFSESHLRGPAYRLMLSHDLRSIGYREYRMSFSAEDMLAIDLAVSPVTASGGFVGVEIVSHDSKVVAQALVELDRVTAERPTRFSLPDKVSLRRGWALRVFVRGATAPVALYELVHTSPFRRSPRRRPFTSLAAKRVAAR
jgi:SAM-dependent methyltransferase